MLFVFSLGLPARKVIRTNDGDKDFSKAKRLIIAIIRKGKKAKIANKLAFKGKANVNGKIVNFSGSGKLMNILRRKNGTRDGSGYGSGYGSGRGSGYESGHGSGYESGHGSGYGSGHGSGYGSGYGSGHGSGYVF